MINYGKTYSSTKPQAVTMTATNVFVANNIEPYAKEVDGYTESGFKYDYISYTKDEYLMAQNEKMAELEQQLEAAKILLGVD